MTLESVYFISQIASTVALVISLIYLSVQTKNNALAVKQAAQQAMVAELGTSFSALFADPECAAIWIKGIASYSSLNGVEKVRFTSLLHKFARNFEQAYFAYRAGNLDVEIWQGLEIQMREPFSCPGIQEWWSLRRHWYTETFRQLLADSNGSSKEYLQTMRDGPPNEI